jgi:hypothetical protein
MATFGPFEWFCFGVVPLVVGFVKYRKGGLHGQIWTDGLTVSAQSSCVVIIFLLPFLFPFSPSILAFLVALGLAGTVTGLVPACLGIWLAEATLNASKKSK